jgi:hypothetical protein
VTSTAYVMGQVFTPRWGACWHCNTKHNKEAACPNTVSPMTHCGPCRNISGHSLLHKAHCPLYSQLQLDRPKSDRPKVLLLAHSVPSSSDTIMVAKKAVSSSSVSIGDTTTPSSPSDVVQIDSGSNGLFLTSISHSDTPVIVGLSIVGTGMILGREAVIAPTFTDNLIGVSPFCSATPLPMSPYLIRRE